jgi:hypothetical protein
MVWLTLALCHGKIWTLGYHGGQRERLLSMHMTAAICFRISEIVFCFLEFCRMDSWMEGDGFVATWIWNGVTKMVEWIGMGMAAFAARCT